MNNDFTIVVPTYREAQNIPELIKRISNINFGDKKFEVILVDDNSNDGTVEIVSELTSRYPWLKLIVRKAGRNLSAAILDGFTQATSSIVIAMDADLSHPPEKINELLTTLINSDVDLVIGSRYVKGGSIDLSWSIRRKIASRLSALIARSLFAANVTDPLSGFFTIKKEKVLSTKILEPIGWKICLEIIVKCHCKNVAEVPIHFTERTQGKSKLNLAIAATYFYHLMQLLRYKLFSRT